MAYVSIRTYRDEEEECLTWELKGMVTDINLGISKAIDMTEKSYKRWGGVRQIAGFEGSCYRVVYPLLKKYKRLTLKALLYEWSLRDYNNYDSYLQWLPREIYEDVVTSLKLKKRSGSWLMKKYNIEQKYYDYCKSINEKCY